MRNIWSKAPVERSNDEGFCVPHSDDWKYIAPATSASQWGVPGRQVSAWRTTRMSVPVLWCVSRSVQVAGTLL
ncbi:hypothetical protein D3C72_1379480 [compost metagenome]